MKKQNSNLLIGAKVIIDYPNRWRGAATPELQARMRAETEASKKAVDRHGAWYFGETGVIVNYDPADDTAKCYDILLDSNKEVVSVNDCEFTVQELAKNRDQEIVDLLTQIREATNAIGAASLELLRRVADQLEKLEMSTPRR